MRNLLRRPRSRNDTTENRDSTKSIARERLQNAINRDRYDLLGPEVMDALRRDILAAISRHLEVSGDCHELELRRLDQSFFLVTSVRVQAVPRLAAM